MSTRWKVIIAASVILISSSAVFALIGFTQAQTNLIPQEYLPYVVKPEATQDPATTATPTSRPGQTPGPPEPDIHITFVEYDPPGDDVQGEYVLLDNRGGGSQDMTAWTLRDHSNHVYHFPYGYILAGDASVRIWTQSGTDSATDLYWSSDFAIWENDGDTAYLRNREGSLVDIYHW